MGKRDSGRGNNMCKDPKVGPFLVCLRNGEKDNELDPSGWRERRSCGLKRPDPGVLMQPWRGIGVVL